MTYGSSNNIKFSNDENSDIGNYSTKCSTSNINGVFFSNSNIETGRIEGGNTSDQTFTFVNRKGKTLKGDFIFV